ncbi:MAG: hypothetical protein JWN70_5718 [Planctomycetaceae bacterium]|nr:hypothetical protein [Planctomycetaceae bacterium]
MQSRTINKRTRGQRSGLAPLELVLALPLLLSVMALIVNFGHAATWKIRGATNARLAMWRHRPMWSADSDPKPMSWWPQAATMGVAGSNRISQVDAGWNQSAIAQGWIKGPVFSGGGGYLMVRDKRVNEMSEGVSQGTSSISQRYPFLPSMGLMKLNVDHSLLDSTWQYETMGYANNGQRRANGWWNLEDSPDWAAEKQVFLEADTRMVSNPQRELMLPLDRDINPWTGGFVGDFYARYRYGNNDPNDPQVIRQTKIINPTGLVDQIKGRSQPPTPGVCKTMAQGYLAMYQTQLALDPQNAQLQQWIQQLKDFIAQLP